MTHQRTEVRNHFLTKQGALAEPLKLTEPHSMFCGTLGFRGIPVEEHCTKQNARCTNYFKLATPVVLRINISISGIIYLDLPD